MKFLSAAAVSAPREAIGHTVADISIDSIRPNPSQPRRIFDRDELITLAKSVSQLGILQPITVRRTDMGYELICGERRLRAAEFAGLKSVPCIIKGVSDQNCALIALVENLQRQDLNFFEVAEGYRILTEKFGLTQQETAVKLGVSQPSVANKLRLLKISPEHRAQILNFHLTERHARALLRLPEEKRADALQTACDQKLNAENFEKYIDEMFHVEQIRQSYRKRASALSDVRLFFNTVEKAVGVMRLAGVNAVTEKRRTDSGIEYVIKINDKDCGEKTDKNIRPDIRTDGD